MNRHLEVWVDGGCHPNPGGRMRIGIFSKLFKVSAYAGDPKGTCNEAEYLALDRAFDELSKRGINGALIYTDSQLMCNQVNGRWGAFARTGRKHIPRLRKKLELGLHTLKWIPREENVEADRLAARMGK